MRIHKAAILPFLALPALAWAEPTRELRVGGAKEMFEGEPVSTSLSARGVLTAGWTVEERTELAAAVTALARGGDGWLYAGTLEGLFAIGDDGPKRVGGEDAVTALAASPRGVWVGTSPAGRVFEVRAGEVEEIVDLDAKYVWAIGFDGSDAYVATGEPGAVLRVERSGAAFTAKVVHSVSDPHVRALLVDGDGLVFGGGARGVVYRARAGKVHALYDSNLDEVTGLAMHDGAIFASVVSAKRKPGLPPFAYLPPVGEDDDIDSAFAGSELVRIGPNGRVAVLWRAQSEGALGLARFGDELLVATAVGPNRKGRVHAVGPRGGDLRLAARVEQPMATALLSDGDDLVAALGPAGGLARLRPLRNGTAEYLSSEQDFQRIGRVGRVWFDALLPSSTGIELDLRTGNTEKADETWSEWSKGCKDARGCAVKVSEGRYAQFRVRLKARGGRSPRLRSMHASVMRLNEAPRLYEVFVLDPGIAMEPLPEEGERDKTVTLSRGSLEKLRREDESSDARAKVMHRDGFRTVAWHGGDTNGDRLVFDVRIRPVREEDAWLSIGTDLEAPFVSFDSRALAAGAYVAEVVASDRPSNPPGDVLTERRVSEPFLIDNAPPVISRFRVRRSGDELVVEARAEDSESMLSEAEISIDGGPWMMIPAEDGMVDSRAEQLRMRFAGEASVVALRVRDDAGNQSSASTRVD